MPSKTPSEALAALVTQRYPIAEEVWGDFWDRLAAKELHPGEALAVLASLTTRMPGRRLGGHAAGLAQERNPRPDPPSRRTVNIVGTGGGPSTFNLSTASAFVAAAMGARVIKTGSRAYASRTGSVDLLDRLGIRQTSSYEQTEEMLETFGMACAGPFVYPKELRMLARQILPFDMKTVGRFFNLIGPFLASVPVSLQITGVSDHSVLPDLPWARVRRPEQGLLGGLERRRRGRADERRGLPRVRQRAGRGIHAAAGRARPERPAVRRSPARPDLDQTVDHFLGLIGGEARPARSRASG